MMVTVEPWPRPGEFRVTLLQDVVAGRYDGEIDRFCGQVSRAGLGVFVRWGHEMELESGRYPWQFRMARSTQTPTGTLSSVAARTRAQRKMSITSGRRRESPR